MRPIVRLFVAGVLSLLVGACNSGGTQARVVQKSSPAVTSGAEAWPAHPCALVPAREIAGVVGGPVQGGFESTWAHGSMCAFGTQATFPVKATATTTVDVAIDGIKISFVDQAVFDARVNNIGPPGSGGQVPLFRKTAIPSLGNQAWEITGIHFDEVVVIEGQYRVWIDAYAGMGELWELELKLAPVVVSGIANAS